MTTLLRSFIARRTLRGLPVFDALLAACLFALLWPSGAPIVIAVMYFAVAWLLQQAMGGFTRAPFHPALAAFALAYVCGAIPASEPTLPACIAWLVIAFDRLRLPITSGGKGAQLALIAIIACVLWWLHAALPAYACALLAVQFLPAWIDRRTLPRVTRPA